MSFIHKATVRNVTLRVVIVLVATYLLSIQPDCASVSPITSICEVQP